MSRLAFYFTKLAPVRIRKNQAVKLRICVHQFLHWLRYQSEGQYYAELCQEFYCFGRLDRFVPHSHVRKGDHLGFLGKCSDGLSQRPSESCRRKRNWYSGMNSSSSRWAFRKKRITFSSNFPITLRSEIGRLCQVF